MLEFPVSVSVMLCCAVLPVFTVPKFKLDGFVDSVRLAATPVPLKATALGELGALLTSETLPLVAPADCGANCTLNVVEAPGFMESGKFIVPALNPLPVTLNCVIVRTPVPLLLS